MCGSGWISLDRKVTDHWLWKDKPFSKGQAWVDLLLMANHEDKKALFDGELKDVSRGSKLTSIKNLSERWGWSRHKTSDFLKLLESDKMITQERTSKSTTVTIVNYSDYQNVKKQKGHQKDIRGTSEGHHKDTNNNNNNNNNVNKVYGEYQNVNLSDSDIEKLKTECPTDWKDRIERLSGYMAQTGKTYKNHLATIRNWKRRDEKQSTPQSVVRKNSQNGFENQRSGSIDESQFIDN